MCLNVSVVKLCLYVSVVKLCLYVSECVCSKIIKELPVLVGSGTSYIFLRSLPRSSKWTLSFWLPHQNPLSVSLLHTHVPHSQPISFC